MDSETYLHRIWLYLKINGRKGLFQTNYSFWYTRFHIQFSNKNETMIYRHRLFSNPKLKLYHFLYDMFQASPRWNIVDFFPGSKFNLLRQMNWAISWSIPCDFRSHQVEGWFGWLGNPGNQIWKTADRFDSSMCMCIYYLTFWVIFDSGQVLGQNVWMDLWIDFHTHCLVYLKRHQRVCPFLVNTIRSAWAWDGPHRRWCCLATPAVCRWASSTAGARGFNWGETPGRLARGKGERWISGGDFIWLVTAGRDFQILKFSASRCRNKDMKSLKMPSKLILLNMIIMWIPLVSIKISKKNPVKKFKQKTHNKTNKLGQTTSSEVFHRFNSGFSQLPGAWYHGGSTTQVGFGWDVKVTSPLVFV